MYLACGIGVQVPGCYAAQDFMLKTHEIVQTSRTKIFASSLRPHKAGKQNLEVDLGKYPTATPRVAATNIIIISTTIRVVGHIGICLAIKTHP